MVTQATRAEITATRRAEKLGMLEYRLWREAETLEQLQAELSTTTARLHCFDEAPPVMLAFVDSKTRYRFHNESFRKRLGLDASKIDGKHMRDVLGRSVFAEVEAYVLGANGGEIMRYERTHRNPGGERYRLALPRFGVDGACEGFYVVMTDITDQHSTAQSPPHPLVAGNPGFATPINPDPGRIGAPDVEETLADDDAATELAQRWHEATQRLLAAIDGDEFTLYCQRIAPLAQAGSKAIHHEMLIRLQEEENNQVPPGAFFPLAEEHGLPPRLDRWVVEHTLEWMATPTGRATVVNGDIYFINTSMQTIADPEFAEFVDYQLRRTGVPGGSLCFELDEFHLILNQGDAVRFAHSVKQFGCKIAISGFGRNSAAVNTLKLFAIDFLKIDGGIVRQILAYPTFLGMVVAINRWQGPLAFKSLPKWWRMRPRWRCCAA